MRLSTSTAILAVATILSNGSSAVASGSNHLSERGTFQSPGAHRSLLRQLRRAVGASEEEHQPHYVNLQKRFNGRATFYNNEVSEGACGGYSSNDDNVVALNVAQYGNPNQVSSWCGKKITISYGGTTQTATVVDCCPSCPYGGLDMSPGLFGAFTSMGTGVFQMTWSSGGSSGGSSNNNNNDQSEQKSTPKTTSTTSHRTTHRTTSTHSRTSTTKTSTSTSSSSTTVSSTSSTSSDSTTATPTSPNNLEDLTEVMRGMMDLANAVQTP